MSNQRSIDKVSSTMSRISPALLFSLILLFFCICHAIWCFSIGWNNTLNDHHSFRQSQTAITAYYLANEPFRLAYETPVLGKPWSIPMEFPIYQYIVAKINNITRYPLDQTGRAVSVAAFFLLLFPVYAILKFRRVSAPHSILCLCILLISPFYLFWSRAFLIESTSLFFCFSYLACLLWSSKKYSYFTALLTIGFGIAAGLSKITTWLPFLAFSGIWLLRDQLCWPIKIFSKNFYMKRLLQVFLFCGIPFIIADLWVKYSDSIKTVHPLDFINTSANSVAWNFGTLAQKLSPDVWLTILPRVITLFGLPPQALLILVSSALSVVITGRRWKESVILFLLFLLSPALFTNLHFIHDYYMTANGIFLLGFVMFGMLSLLESASIKVNSIGWLLLLFVIFSGICGYATIYQPVQEAPNSEILQLTEAIKKNTSQDSILIILGADWNPLVPYYSQRRSLMVPDWDTLTEGQVEQALENLKGEKIGALLICEQHRYSEDLLIQQLKGLGFSMPIIRCGPLPLR